MVLIVENLNYYLSKYKMLREIANKVAKSENEKSDHTKLYEIFRKTVDSGILLKEAEMGKFSYKLKIDQLIYNDRFGIVIVEEFPCLFWSCEEQGTRANIETIPKDHLDSSWNRTIKTEEAEVVRSVSVGSIEKSGVFLGESVFFGSSVSLFSRKSGLEFYMVFRW